MDLDDHDSKTHHVCDQDSETGEGRDPETCHAGDDHASLGSLPGHASPEPQNQRCHAPLPQATLHLVSCTPPSNNPNAQPEVNLHHQSPSSVSKASLQSQSPLPIYAKHEDLHAPLESSTSGLQPTSPRNVSTHLKRERCSAGVSPGEPSAKKPALKGSRPPRTAGRTAKKFIKRHETRRKTVQGTIDQLQTQSLQQEVAHPNPEAVLPAEAMQSHPVTSGRSGRRRYSGHFSEVALYNTETTRAIERHIQGLSAEQQALVWTQLNLEQSRAHDRIAQVPNNKWYPQLPIDEQLALRLAEARFMTERPLPANEEAAVRQAVDNILASSQASPLQVAETAVSQGD